METSQANVGEYNLDLYLNDGYEFGQNERLYSIKIFIEIPDRPFVSIT